MPKLKTEKTEPKTEGDMRPGGNARAMLYGFVERFERLQEERDALGEDQKEIMAEAKSSGFDTAILRTAIRRRKKDTASVMEADSILDMYERTLREVEAEQLAKSEEDAT